MNYAAAASKAASGNAPRPGGVQRPPPSLADSAAAFPELPSTTAPSRGKGSSCRSDPAVTPAAAAAAAAAATASHAQAPPAQSQPTAQAAAATAAVDVTSRFDQFRDLDESPKADDAHIAFLEAAVARAATVPFAAVAAAIAKDGADDGTCGVSTQLLRVLDTFGFAIVTDVLQPGEVAAMEALWAADLMSIVAPPADARESAALATNKYFKYLTQDPVHHWPMKKLSLGMKSASDYGLPQGRLGWAARRNANAQKVFAALHGTPELCVGMDNIFFDNRVVRGIEHDTQRMSPLWPHADQNKFIEGGDFPIWQGVLYLWPATPETSATVVWPGSHKAVYEALMASRDWKRSGHYCMLPKQQLADFAQHARRVPVPPGAMLLWSSRCIHQGWPVGPRLAVPLCFEPKFRRPAKAVSTKVELVRKGTPSTHWASICSPHTLGGKIRNRTELEGEPLIRVQHGAHRFMFGSSQADIPSDIFGLF